MLLFVRVQGSKKKDVEAEPDNTLRDVVGEVVGSDQCDWYSVFVDELEIALDETVADAGLVWGATVELQPSARGRAEVELRRRGIKLTMNDAPSILVADPTLFTLVLEGGLHTQLSPEQLNSNSFIRLFFHDHPSSALIAQVWETHPRADYDKLFINQMEATYHHAAAIVRKALCLKVQPETLGRGVTLFMEMPKEDGREAVAEFFKAGLRPDSLAETCDSRNRLRYRAVRFREEVSVLQLGCLWSAELGLWILETWGGNVGHRDVRGRTPLYCACSHGSSAVALVEALLARGADVNATRPCGRTPLSAAAYAGDPDIVGTLLREGADASKGYTLGSTAVVTLVKHGRFSALQCFASCPLSVSEVLALATAVHRRGISLDMYCFLFRWVSEEELPDGRLRVIQGMKIAKNCIAAAGVVLDERRRRTFRLRKKGHTPSD